MWLAAHGPCTIFEPCFPELTWTRRASKWQLRLEWVPMFSSLCFIFFQSRPQILSPHGFLNSWPDVLGAAPGEALKASTLAESLVGRINGKPSTKHFFLMCQADFGLYLRASKNNLRNLLCPCLAKVTQWQGNPILCPWKPDLCLLSLSVCNSRCRFHTPVPRIKLPFQQESLWQSPQA